MLQKEIEAKLSLYQDAYLQKDLISTKLLKNVTISSHRIHLDITLGYPCNSLKNIIINDLKQLLATECAGFNLEISVNQKIEEHTGLSQLPALPNVKNIIAVASGKGGVGKSTLAVNVALALAKDARVGLLDADIYGPSQPAMLGAKDEKPEMVEQGLKPIVRHGLQSMSIGYLIAQNAPMIWRGPMIGKALQQLLQDTKWDNLDYLIIDLPPGTGDIQLTLCQKMPLSGAIIVTTPQDLALLDVRRACEMFNKMNVPLLGVVENMSSYHCNACGHEENIFGEGGAFKLASDYGLDLLGQVPLNVQIRKLTDSGVPPALDENNHLASLFTNIALKAAAKLSLQAKNYAAKFPKVVVRQGD